MPSPRDTSDHNCSPAIFLLLFFLSTRNCYSTPQDRVERKNDDDDCKHHEQRINPLFSSQKTMAGRPALSRTPSAFNLPTPPATANNKPSDDVVLELSDGTAFRGSSFGAEGTSVAGECVFQTGRPLKKKHRFFSFFITRNGGIH